MSEHLSNKVKQLGIESESVIVGDGPLDELVRHQHELHLTVEPQAYRNLRELHAWQESRQPNGQTVLQNGDTSVTTDWNGATLETLRDRSFTDHGVDYIGLPDVYTWKQQNATPENSDDLALIRERLYDRPLPLTMLHRELAFVREVAPHNLPDHAALAVAANGLHIVRTIFGDHKHTINSYTGQVEPGNVAAAYHEFWHSGNGVERIARHITALNQGRIALEQTVAFSLTDTYASMVAFAYHDSYLGDGRQSANPDGFDELRAAEIAARHLSQAGCVEDDMPNKSYVGIRATAFNEATMSQDITPARGYEHIQAAVAGTDLGIFAEPRFVTETMCLTIEDLMRVGAGFDRPLDRKAKQIGIRITNIDQALRIIDQDPRLLYDFAKRLSGSANFCRTYVYHDQWTLDRPDQRAANANFAKEISEAIASRHITASEAYAQALLFAGQA